MNRSTVAILVGLAVSFIVAFGLSFALAAAGAEPGSSPWIMGAVVGTTVGAALSNMSGNKKVTQADDAQRSAALAMTPGAGRGLVVIYREGFIARAVGADVALDGKDVAQLKSPRFTAIEASPGDHRLTVTLAGKINAGSKPGEAAFDLAAGETAVFRVTMKMKLATSDVVVTRDPDPAAARGKLARLRMIAPTA